MNKKIRPGKSNSDEKLEKSLVYFIDSIENIMLNLGHYDKLAYIYVGFFIWNYLTCTSRYKYRKEVVKNG